MVANPVKHKSRLQAILNNSLAVNMFSLGLVQITNFIIPLITYPYLFQILGADKFGVVTYALNIMLYLTTIVDYGFNLSAPKSVALAKGDEGKLSTIVSSVLQIKLYLFIFIAALILISSSLIPVMKKDIVLYVFGIVYIIGNAALPTWLFQGLEEMKYITWLNMAAKVILTVLIFLFIKEPSQYIYVVGLYGLANLFSGLAAISYALKKYAVSLTWQSSHVIKKELRDGFSYFASNISSIAFSNSTIIILGFFVSNATLGFYSLSEKIAFALWQLLSVYSQATFPVVCRYARESISRVKAFYKRVYLPFIGLITFFCILIYVFSNYLIIKTTGSDSIITSNILKILCWFPVIVGLNIPAFQLIIAKDKQVYNAKVFNLAVVFHIVICAVLSNLYGSIGAAWAALITQALLTVSLYLIVIKLKLIS